MTLYIEARIGVIKPQYKCSQCGDLHDDENDALECCPKDIWAVYVCPRCDKEHHDEEAAIDCCGFDPDGPPPPSAAELEAAGQIRLEGC